jgi:hypothetical protein
MPTLRCQGRSWTELLNGYGEPPPNGARRKRRGRFPAGRRSPSATSNQKMTNTATRARSFSFASCTVRRCSWLMARGCQSRTSRSATRWPLWKARAACWRLTGRAYGRCAGWSPNTGQSLLALGIGCFVLLGFGPTRWSFDPLDAFHLVAPAQSIRGHAKKRRCLPSAHGRIGGVCTHLLNDVPRKWAAWAPTFAQEMVEAIAKRLRMHAEYSRSLICGMRA